ncbi:MAG TPA: hypothetical protein DDY29_11340 [Rhodobacteraceae bacterium]|jgi:membrane protein implicated in regulation of membrane protease activity|nr:hypothetical protein [Paracoccaceae bacterium]HBG99277.1 hypothetical protein [Paracoccaceae bacterium]
MKGRETDGKRKPRDAARLLPAFGLAAFVLPVAWAGQPDVRVAIYVFLVWAVLIGLAAWLARRLSRGAER